MITGTPIIDPDRGFTEELTLGRAAKRGQRHYLVNTDRTDLAVTASGVPARGDAWSAQHPDLVVVQVGPVVRLGGVPDGLGEGAWSRVPVLYETPSAASFRPATPDDAYTELELAGGSQTVKYPIERTIRGQPNVFGNPNEPLNGGDGESIPVTTIRARVHTFWDAQTPLPVIAWLALCSPLPTLNDAPLRFPRVFGMPSRFTVGRGQARYMGFERPEAIEGTALVRVVHVVDLAESFLIEWQRRDQNRNAVGPVFQDRFFEFRSLASLWPA